MVEVNRDNGFQSVPGASIPHWWSNTLQATLKHQSHFPKIPQITSTVRTSNKIATAVQYSCNHSWMWGYYTKLDFHESYKQIAALQGDCKTPMNHVQDMRDLHKNSPSMNPKSAETQTPNDIDTSHSQPPYITKLPCHMTCGMSTTKHLPQPPPVNSIALP